jgi:hypothetical protein
MTWSMSLTPMCPSVVPSAASVTQNDALTPSSALSARERSELRAR